MKSFNETTKIQIGKFVFTQLEHVEWNNHKYSKGWHRQYGGVREVSGRRIVIEKIDRRAKSGKKQMAVVPFDSWRGNVLLSAIKQSGLFQVPQSKAPLSVRLDKFYGAEEVRTIGHIKIYERTLLGEFVDFCAVLNGVTFHAETERLAVRGVHQKIKAATKKRNEPISYKLCKELGFCDAGIKQFCEVFSLDLHSSYSPERIEELVKANTEKAAPFEGELRTMAKALNYQASI